MFPTLNLAANHICNANRYDLPIAELRVAVSEKNKNTQKQTAVLNSLQNMTVNQKAALSLFEEACDAYNLGILNAQYEVLITSENPIEKGQAFLSLFTASQSKKLSPTIQQISFGMVKRLDAQNAFIDMDLSNSNLSQSDLSGLHLNGINLSGAILTGAKLNQTNLTGATISNATLNHAELVETILIDINLSYADLQGAKLNNATLINANLTHTNLTDADLSEAILIKSNLSWAMMTRADLTKATLFDTTLQQASVTDITLTAAKLICLDTTLNELTEKGSTFTTPPLSINKS